MGPRPATARDQELIVIGDELDPSLCPHLLFEERPPVTGPRA